MNTIMEMNPWGLLDELFGVSSRPAQVLRARAAGRFPPVNVYLDDSAVLIDLELPGVTAKDVELTLEPEAVVVSDKPTMTTDAETGKADAKRPAWSRRINLPFRVNEDKANARFTNGILRIELPKAESTGVKRIAIAG